MSLHENGDIGRVVTLVPKARTGSNAITSFTELAQSLILLTRLVSPMVQGVLEVTAIYVNVHDYVSLPRQRWGLRSFVQDSPNF